MPLAVQMLQPAATASEEEARILSAAPAWPQTARDWLALPRQLDRFFGDHFGLRSELVRAHARLRYAADLPSDLRVIIGRDNWLFFAGDGTIEQATGKLLREAQIAKFADRAATLRTALAAKGARLIVAIPPNGPTINRARLPAWAAEAPAVTEYDLMMRALGGRGVEAVDLRVPLLAARPAGLSPHRHALEQVRRPGRLQRRGRRAGQARLDHRPGAGAARLRAGCGRRPRAAARAVAGISPMKRPRSIFRPTAHGPQRSARSRPNSRAAAISSRPGARERPFS